MLKAVLHGKAGRIQLSQSEKNISWRQIFKGREDLLTAVFMSRVPYLSAFAFDRLMSFLIGDDALRKLGTFQEINFWPYFHLDQGNEQIRGVEPDIVLYFENGIVLIEVKPPFHGVQNIGQWKRELHAVAQQYLKEDPSSEKNICFLALGGNGASGILMDAAEKKIGELGGTNYQLNQREWQEVVDFIAHWENEEATLPSDQAILKDWLSAFELWELFKTSHFKWSDIQFPPKANNSRLFLLSMKEFSVRMQKLNPLESSLNTDNTGIQAGLDSLAKRWLKLVLYTQKHQLKI